MASVPLPDAKRVTIAKAVLEQTVLKHRAFKELITDNAKYFTSECYQEFWVLLRVEQKFVTPYQETGPWRERFVLS